MANTVGPVLDEKLEALRDDFRKVGKAFDNEIKKARLAPIPQPIQKGEMDERQWANLKTCQTHKGLKGLVAQLTPVPVPSGQPCPDVAREC